jgi:hypothetical protein
VVRVLQLVATPKASRRGPRKRNAEEPQGDGRQWPMLREQQALQAHLGAAEQAAAAHRAELLVSQGWGALEAWLNHPGQHPGERPAAAPNRDLGGSQNPAGLADMADLFDAA